LAAVGGSKDAQNKHWWRMIWKVIAIQHDEKLLGLPLPLSLYKSECIDEINTIKNMKNKLFNNIMLKNAKINFADQQKRDGN